MKTLPQVIDEIKAAATSSGLINQIKMVKVEKDIDDIFEDANFRSLYIVIDDADILGRSDYFGISLFVMDKATNSTDDAYLYSIQDGIAVLRIISDRLNYVTDGSIDAKLGNINIVSGESSGELITLLNTTISYALSPVPNIHIND